MYSMVLADALRRWQALKGRPAVLSTGTDEHGMKVQRAAERAGTTPRQLCDANSQSFRDLAAACNLSPSPDGRFVRTTDRAHVDAVTHVWTELARRDYIYASRHAGWYCVQDEAFYPESAVERRWDPLTGRAVVASVETGGEVEWVEETNYHFRLSAFRDQLLDFYRQRPDWIVPKARMNEVVAWVDKPGGLEDLSVSRPSERLSWGIPVPGDPSQTIYVWIDALVNYATVAGYPNLGGGMDASASLWPPDVHVIGKDITRFHCVYWPAMLFALGLEPPSRVLSHAHWTLGRRKMSKSRGNVVNPFFAIDRFGTDVVRYYLLHDGGIADDADYENSFVVERYKHNLQSGLGNLVSRVTRPRKLWKVEEAVAAVGDGDVPPGAIPDRDGLVVNLASFVEAVDRDMERLQPSAALKSIQKIVDEVSLSAVVVTERLYSC